MDLFAFSRRARFASPRWMLAGTAAALALAAFAATPAQSADFPDYRYGERSYEAPVPAYPQAVYERERSREYRVIVAPERRYRTYEYESGYRAPYPNAYPSGYDNGNGDYAQGRTYERGYRDGVEDASRGNGAYGGAEPYVREYDREVLLPPAPVPVDPPRRVIYTPGY